MLQSIEEVRYDDIRHFVDAKDIIERLAPQLQSRELSPKELAQQVFRSLCEFYDADWCGLVQFDLDLKLWTLLWWYNTNADDKTLVLMEEFESADFLDRWVVAVQKNMPVIIPDVEKLSCPPDEEEKLYNRKSCGALQRNGKYYVVDGQHTIEGRILRNGGKDLPILCKVYTGLTMEQEALFFAEQNGHSAPLTAGIKLRAKVVGGDAPSKAFLAATNRVGLAFNYDSLQLSNYRISCVGTALKLYNQMGEKIYCESLRLIVAAWDGKPDSFRASVLRGMMHFVELYRGEFSEERLICALGSVHPMEIYRVGRDNPAKLPGWKKYVFPIYMAYNGKGRKDALPMKF